MNSFNQNHQSSSFRYNSNSNKMNNYNDDQDDVEFSGFLDIYIHHAKNIHNICIYDNQDVYAKFSLTYNPDETLSTRIINKGGKNPIFNQNLRLKIIQLDAVLKCEIWMFSRSRNHLEDQLLGFTLVPISQIFGKGKVTDDYSLSSTDLFHSPAGTVQLTLLLDTSFPINSSLSSMPQSSTNSSISSEVVLLDPIEYSRIEFPDINVVNENQKMVYEYFNSESYGSVSRPNLVGSLPFLHLGGSSSPQVVVDCEMIMNSSGENHESIVSPNENIHSSRFPSSTSTSLSDDRNSSDSIEKKSNLRHDLSNSFNALVSIEGNIQNSCIGSDTPTSKKEIEARNDKDSMFSSKEKETNNGKNIEAAKFGQVFSVPPRHVDMEAEQSSMQQQIVDMYMRSMQQFTESLAKMKLPMDLDHKPDNQNQGDVIQNPNSKLENDKKKNDGSRVFYGSRAFF
ncbi:hypothetical protein P8452_20317 [Trifolium repens]|nr:hypothetical protein P8452_20317 [Trifolium repens]